MSRSRAGLMVLALALATPVARVAAQPAAAEAEGANGSAGAGANGSGDANGSGAAGANGSGAAGANGSGAAAGSGSAAGSASRAAPRDLTLPLELGAPEVQAAASPTIASLGARFTLYVTATFGPGVEVNLREPFELGPAFEVRRKLSEDRPSGDGRTTREWQIEVTPWELGDLRIAPITVTFTAQGRVGQVETNAVPLKIIGVLGDMVDDPNAMRGLAPPAGLSTHDWFWIWCATAIGAGVGVVVAALWLRRRRARRTRQLLGGALARPPRIDMTGERALERLLAIERSGVLDRDDARKLGYAELVEVIRDYLGGRYRIAVHDLTSSELIRRLGDAASADEVALIAGWLEDCDLVKYGGARSSPAEAGKALDDARALIVTTTQLHAAGSAAAKAVA